MAIREELDDLGNIVNVTDNNEVMKSEVWASSECHGTSPNNCTLNHRKRRLDGFGWKYITKSYNLTIGDKLVTENSINALCKGKILLPKTRFFA